MKISIVVPAFNEEKLLGRSLAAIKESARAFAGQGWDWELIVSNNNSTDRTEEIALAAGARVVFEPVNQISRARNKGGFAATGDWIVFVDADSFPSRALFRRVAEEIETGKYVGGGCLVRMDEPMPVVHFLVGLWNTLSRIKKWAAGSFIFCKADAFREINGFSDKLFASEELDFSERLKKAGRKRGLKMRIIADERLVTSARKMHLYKPREHLRYFFRAMISPRRFTTTREECAHWYDGRR